MDQVEKELSLLIQVLDCLNRTKDAAELRAIRGNNDDVDLFTLLNKSSINVVNKINSALDAMSSTVQEHSAVFDALYDEHFGKNSPLREPIKLSHMPAVSCEPVPCEPEHPKAGEDEIIIRKPVFD